MNKGARLQDKKSKNKVNFIYRLDIVRTPGFYRNSPTLGIPRDTYWMKWLRWKTMFMNKLSLIIVKITTTLDTDKLQFFKLCNDEISLKNL